MKRSRLIAIGAAAFVLALIAGAPAAVLYGWFAPKAGGVELFGLQGTLLKGSVAGVALQGRPAWQSLNWTLHPLWLLTGRLVADVDTATPAAVRTRVGIAPWGASLSNVRASGSVRALLGAVGQGYLPVAGQMTADLPSLRMRAGKPQSAEGTIDVEGLSWTLSKDPVVLGNFRATATTADRQIQLKIESVSGPLEVSGTGSLGEDQSYAFDLRVKVKPGAAPMVQTLVQSLGQPDPQGFYRVQRKGKLG